MDLDNFFFGLQSVSHGAIDLARLITKFELFWGFTLGFIVSTLVHGVLMTDNPRDVPSMVLQDKATSFQKIYDRQEGDSYKQSFHSYSQNVNKMKLTFALAGLLVVLVLLIALLSF